MPSPPEDGDVYSHGIDLSNWHVCHNISLKGTLCSVGVVNETGPGIIEARRSLPSFPSDDIRLSTIFNGVLSPMVARNFVPAAIFESGQELVNGYGELIDHTDARKLRLIEKSDLEVAFEKGRLKYNPLASSRLSSIFLAERSEQGRASIWKMLSTKVYIVEVRVLYERSLTKADGGWFTAYQNGNRDDFIKSYWLGERCPDPGDSAWEYVFEGVIEIVNPDELEHIHKYGAKLTNTRRKSSEASI